MVRDAMESRSLPLYSTTTSSIRHSTIGSCRCAAALAAERSGKLDLLDCDLFYPLHFCQSGRECDGVRRLVKSRPVVVCPRALRRARTAVHRLSRGVRQDAISGRSLTIRGISGTGGAILITIQWTYVSPGASGSSTTRAAPDDATLVNGGAMLVSYCTGIDISSAPQAIGIVERPALSNLLKLTPDSSGKVSK